MNSQSALLILHPCQCYVRFLQVEWKFAIKSIQHHLDTPTQKIRCLLMGTCQPSSIDFAFSSRCLNRLGCLDWQYNSNKWIERERVSYQSSIFFWLLSIRIKSTNICAPRSGQVIAIRPTLNCLFFIFYCSLHLNTRKISAALLCVIVIPSTCRVCFTWTKTAVCVLRATTFFTCSLYSRCSLLPF